MVKRVLMVNLLVVLLMSAAASRLANASRDHKAFAALSARLSEPGGYFDSDNLISNETSYLHVMAKLKEIGVSGGVYVGVGPDQSFSYIAKIRPRMAIRTSKSIVSAGRLPDSTPRIKLCAPEPRFLIGFRSEPRLLPKRLNA